mgnify:CR=1 FL=1
MNVIPLSVYNLMFLISFGLIIFMCTQKDNLVRIVISFISMILAYILAFVSLSGNLVSISDTNTLYVITSTTLNYFWLFIAIVMGIFTILFIADEINIKLMNELEEATAEE